MYIFCSVARSPVYAHFSETISGLAVIRGFRKTGQFVGETGSRLNDLTRCEIAGLGASAWLSIRLQLIAFVVVAVVVAAAILGRVFDWTSVNHVLFIPAYFSLIVAMIDCRRKATANRKDGRGAD